MNFKKFLNKSVRFGALIAVVFAIGSCTDNVGLGESVDTDAPTISIEYPPASAAVRGTFTFAGYWSDDHGVERIALTITNSNTKKTYEANAVTINADKTWSVQVNDYNEEAPDYVNGFQLPDGKYELEVTAYDAAGHSSGKSSRTIEVDNTAPVVVLKSPGTTDIAHATAYGSSFKVNGTIADDHTISSMVVSIYDQNGTTLLNTEPYIEDDVQTAGGTSVTMLKFSENATEEINQRYTEIYGTDKDRGTIPFYCSITISDTAKEYTDPTETENTSTGNTTATFYLYDDVYTSLMSEKVGKGLSASDLMMILNGTYEGSKLARAAADTDDDNTVEGVRALLKQVGVDTTREYLAFSLNPAVNPTYSVSGYNLSKELTAPALQPITVVLNMGLDESLLLPNTFRAYLKDFGEIVPTADTYSEFVNFDAAELAAYAEDAANNTVLFASNEDYQSSSVENYQWTINLPDEISVGHWYLIAVTGTDADENELVANDVFGFTGTSAGLPPKLTVTGYSEAVNAVNDIVISGSASSSEADITLVTYTVTVTDLDDATASPTTLSGQATLTVDATSARKATWEISKASLEAATGYAVAAPNKNLQYTFVIVAKDGANSASYDQEVTVLVDTAKPKLAYTKTYLADGAIITPTDYNFIEVNGALQYRFAGEWQDINGSGTAVLNYAVNGGEAVELVDFASATTTREWTVDLPIIEVDGTGSIEFWATDKAGNESDKLSFTDLTFDYNAPELQAITTPSASVRVGGKISATGTLSDSLALKTKEQNYGITVAAVQTVQGTAKPYTLSSDECTLVQNDDGTVSYALEIDAADNTGTWGITINAVDKAGRAAPTLSYIIKVDSEAPTIAVTDTEPLYFKSTIPQTFGGTMADNVGVTSVYYIVAETTEQPAFSTSSWNSQVSIENDEATEWAATINFKAYSEGETRYIFFAAADEVGNVQIADTPVQVVIDNTAPTTTLLATSLFDEAGTALTEGESLASGNTYFAKDTFTFGGTITEANFAKATISLNGGQAQDITVATDNTWTLDDALVPTTDGSYTYEITLEDKAEQLKTYDITIKRDTKKPNVTINLENDKAVYQTDGDYNANQGIFTVRGTWNDTDATASGTKTLLYKFYNERDTEPESWLTTGATTTYASSSQWTVQLSDIIESTGNIFKLRATDLLGNAEEQTYTGITFDLSAPEIIVNEEIAARVNTAVTVTGTVSDKLAITPDDAASKGSIAITATRGTGETATTIAATYALAKDSSGNELANTYAYELSIPVTDASGNAIATNDGTWVITFVATDDAGQKTVEDSITTTIDTQAPSLSSLKAETTGATIDNAVTYFKSTQPLTFTLTAADTGTGVQSVTYFAVAGTQAAPTTAAQKAALLAGAKTIAETPLMQQGTTTTWNTTITDFNGKDDGIYTIFAIAADVVNNETWSEPLVVCADKTLPTITHSAEGKSISQSGEYYIGVSEITANSFALSGTFTEENYKTGNFTVAAKKDGQTITIPASQVVVAPNATAQNYTWTLTQNDVDTEAGGVFAYTITVTDKAGNATPLTRTVIIDTQAPTIALTTFGDTGGAQTITLTETVTEPTINDRMVTFGGTVTDNTSGSQVKSLTAWYVALDADGTESSTKAGETTVSFDTAGKWTQDFKNIADGWYALHLVAEDNAGNKTEETVQKFGIDKNAPTSTLTFTSTAIKAKVGTEPVAFAANTNYGEGATAKLTGESDTVKANRWNDGKDTYIAKESFTLGGTVSDAFTTSFATNTITLSVVKDKEAVTVSNFSPTTAGVWSYTQTVNATTHADDGEYTYTLTAKDGAGNEASYAFIVRVDTTAPDVTILKPAENANVSEGALSLSGTVSDEGAGVKQVTYALYNKSDVENGSPKANATAVKTGTTTVDNGRWTAETTLENQGELAVIITAQDYLETSAATTPVTFFYDSIPPVLTALTITDTKKTGAEYYDTNLLNVSVTATDAVSAVNTVWYKLVKEGGSVETATKRPMSNSTGNTYTAQVNATDGDGTYTLYVYANDERGNETTTPTTTTIKVDATKPEFGTVSVVAASNEAITVSGTVKEEIGLSTAGITVTATQNGTTSALTFETTVTGDSATKNWTFTLPKGDEHAYDGIWKFTISATDLAGSVSTTTATTVLDTKAPTWLSDETNPFAIGGRNYAESNWYASGNLTVQAYFNEDATGSGITAAHYYVYEDANATTARLNGALTPSALTGTASVLVQIQGIENGNYIAFTATDKAGNMLTTKKFPIKIDNKAPTIQNTSNTAGLNFTGDNKVSEVTLTYTVIEPTNESGLDENSISVAIDGVPVDKANFTATVGNEEVEGVNTKRNVTLTLKTAAFDGLDSGGTTEGTALSITTTVNDLAGNAKTQPISTLLIDTKAPTVTFAVDNALLPVSTDGEKSLVNKSITVTGTATDSSGVQWITLTGSIDGTTQSITWPDSTDFEYNESTKAWKAIFDTTKLYNGSEQKPLTLTVRASDGSNATPEDAPVAYADNANLYLDQKTDRPVVDVTSVNEDEVVGYVLTNKKQGELKGSVSDDDATTAAKVQALGLFIVGKDDTITQADVTITTAENTTTIKHPSYGTTTTTLSPKNGSWTATPPEDYASDGSRVAYFYVKDNAGTEFFTKAADGVLSVPYWTVNGEESTKTDTDNKASSGLSYLADGLNPQFISAKVYAYEDAAGTKPYYKNADGSARAIDAGSSAIVGGVKARYIKLVLTAGDANGINKMHYILSQATSNKTLEGEISVSDSDAASKFVASAVQNAKGDALTGRIWTTDILDLGEAGSSNTFDTGTVLLYVEATDGGGQEGDNGSSWSLSADYSAPTVKYITPNSTLEQIGSVTVGGQANDVGGAGVESIQFAIPGIKITNNRLSYDASSTVYGGNLVSTATPESWSFNFNGAATGNKTFLDYVNAYKNAHIKALGTKQLLVAGDSDLATDIWSIPVYFRVTDALGNTHDYTVDESDYTAYSVRYNPNADMPYTTITYPTTDVYDKGENFTTLSGQIRVTGSVTIESPDVTVAATYLQVGAVQADGTTVDWTQGKAWASGTAAAITADELTAYSQTSAATDLSLSSLSNVPSDDWWGIKAANTTSWYVTLNKKSGLNPSSDVNKIAIRACAVNSVGKMGNWSETIYIHVDDQAPKLTYLLEQYDGTPTAGGKVISSRDYSPDMYLRNPDDNWWLKVTMEDESGIDIDNIAYTPIGVTSAHIEQKEKYGTNAVAGSTDHFNWIYYIPVSSVSGASSYTVAVSDFDGNGTATHTARMNFTLNIDNDAPTMGELLTDIKNSSSTIKHTKLRNNNYGVTFTATAEDSGSGFSRLAYFFKRTVQGQTTIELPVPIATGSNWKSQANGAQRLTLSSSVVEGTTTGTTVSLSETDDSSGLYGVWLKDGTRADTTSFAHAAVSHYAELGVIRAGSLAKLGGTYVRVKSVSGTTVTFETDQTSANYKEIGTDYTDAFFIFAFIVDNTNGESGTWTNGVQTIAKDDGDGMVEYVERSGTQWTWGTTFYSDMLQDGPLYITTAAFDEAENIATQNTYVMIANNTPRLTKVYLATDLNGDDAFEQSEFVEGSVYLSASTEETGARRANEYTAKVGGSGTTEADTAVVTLGGRTGDWANAIDPQTYLTKLFRISDNSVLTMEFVSGSAHEGYGQGNNGITPFLRVGSAALAAPDTTQTHALSALAEANTLTAITYENAKGNRGILLPKTLFYNNGKVTTYGDYTESTKDADTTQYLTLTLWDNTLGTTPGNPDGSYTEDDETISVAGFGSQYQVLNIPVYYDLVDDKAPEVSTPTISAAVGEDNTPFGHVEQSASLPAKFSETSGEFDNDPKLSGRVVFTGTISDNKRIKNISVKMGNGTNYIYNAASTHLLAQLQGGKLVKEADEAQFRFSIDKQVFSQEDGHTIDWSLVVYTSEIRGNQSYTANDIPFVLTVNDDAGQNVAPTLLRFDVVPYITSVTRSASTKSEEKTTYRSTYGEYPVAVGDTLTVKGFNIGGSRSTPTVQVGTGPVTKQLVTEQDTTTQTHTTYTVTGFARSGELTFTVNGVESLNQHNNNNESYNQEAEVANTAEKSSTIADGVLYDNRYLRVWDVGHYFGSSKDGYKPTFATDNEGNLFSTWTLMGTASVQMERGLNNANKAIMYHYDQPDQESWLSIDKSATNGNASVIYFPANVGSGGTPTSNGYADSKNLGGAWGVAVPNDLATGVSYPNDGKRAVKITGNPYYNTDNNAYTAGWQLASYAMRREISQFQNGRTVRRGDVMHFAYYDKMNKALRYTQQSYTANAGNTTDAYRYIISGWNVIDGSTDGQDKVHRTEWRKDDPTNDIAPIDSVLTYKSISTNRKTINYTSTQNAAIGNTAGIAYTDATGVYRLALREITNVNNDSDTKTLTFAEAIPAGTVENLIIYRGESNVVADYDTALGAISSVGTYLGLDVTSEGYPVIVYFDADNETLRIARSTATAPDMTTTAGAKSWKRQTLAAIVSGGTHVQAKIDGNNYLHIIYRNSKGELCYLVSTNNPNNGTTAYTFGTPMTIDTAGTYGTLSFIRSGTTDNYTYMPCVSWLNSEGTANGVKYAVLHNVDRGTVAGEAQIEPKWDVQIIPAVKGNYVSGGEFIYTEGFNGWTANNANITDSVNTAQCDAIVGYNTGRMDVLFLKSEAK